MSTPSSSLFHTFPQLTSQEKADIKRVKGQISCAECRRLKLKCDKKTPCSSCARRGCGSICPTGTLMSMNTPARRSIALEVALLHRKLEEMGQRIRQLEDALAVMQASVSSEPHPLLRDEYLDIKFPPEKSDDHGTQVSTSDLADELGTLNISEDGNARYLGRSGGTESLLGVHSTSSSSSPSPNSQYLDQFVQDPVTAGLKSGNSPSTISQDILHLSNSFPFAGSWDVPASLESTIHYLPNKFYAVSLCEIYFKQSMWCSDIVSMEELIEDILMPMYTYMESVNSQQDQPHPEEEEVLPISPHRLAILFFVLAIGSLMDSTLPPGNIQAEDFFELGKACLVLNDVFTMPELGTVQALFLVHLYYHHGSPKYSPEAAWSVIGFCGRLVHRLGLHSESSKWELDPKALNRRRTVFWEIFAMDALLSSALGRPPSINLSFVNCPFPDEQQSSSREPDQINAIRLWWKFAKEVMTEVARSALTPKVPDYNVTLGLDKKLRECNFSLDVIGDKPNLWCLRVMALVSPFTLMQLHRPFFAKAILDFGHDPLRSPYAISFVAAYRAASTIIEVVEDTFSRNPAWTSRMWSMVSNLLSAGVINGSIAIHCPTSSLAPKAFNNLRLTLDILSSLRESSSRARAAHTILEKIHGSATAIFNQTPGQRPNRSEMSDNRLALTDDLEMWAGYTKVRVNKSDGKSSKPGQSRVPSTSPQPETGDSGGDSNPDYRLPSHVPLLEAHANYGGNPYVVSAFGMSSRGLEDKWPNRQSGNYATQDLSAPPANPGHGYQEPNQLGHPIDGPLGFQWQGLPQMVPTTTGHTMSDGQWLAYMRTGESFDLDTNANLNTHITPYHDP